MRILFFILILFLILFYRTKKGTRRSKSLFNLAEANYYFSPKVIVVVPLVELVLLPEV